MIAAGRRLVGAGRLRVAALAVLASALVLVLAGGDDGPVVCPWRRCTGVECPGCGLTRSAARLVSGDVAGAFARHPLGPVLGLQALVIGSVALVRPRLLGRAALVALLAADAAALWLVWLTRLP